MALRLPDDDIRGGLAVELDAVRGVTIVRDAGTAELRGEVGGEGGLHEVRGGLDGAGCVDEDESEKLRETGGSRHP